MKDEGPESLHSTPRLGEVIVRIATPTLLFGVLKMGRSGLLRRSGRERVG